MFRPIRDTLKFFKTALRATLDGAITTASQPANWLVEFFRGNDLPNKKIKASDALTLPEVWYAVTRIAGNIGTLPLHQLESDKQDERKSRKMREHPAWKITHRRANPYTGAAVFRETLIVHALLRGNGRARIVRNSRQQATELHLLPVDTKTVLVNGKKYHVLDCFENGKWLTDVYSDDEVVHILGLSFDGIVGIDMMEFAGTSMGSALAQLKATYKGFQNYGVPGLLLTAPRGMFADDDAATDFLKRFRERQSGIENAGKTAMVNEGMTVTVLQQNLKEMQGSENRELSRQDAALWFLLESIVGDKTASSYNSLEQKNLAYLTNCLGRWLTRVEQEFDEKLFNSAEKDSGRCYHKFNEKGLLRMDAKSQAEAHSQYIQMRAKNPNEVREDLDLPPYPGGDVYENPGISPGKPGTGQSSNGNPKP